MEDSVLASDAEMFLAEWGDEIIYRPAGGTARTILAVIDRNPPAGISESPSGGIGKSITIDVANRATSVDDDEYGGISSDEVDTGGDKVDVALRIGLTAQSRMISRVLSQDAGMMQLEVR